MQTIGNFADWHELGAEDEYPIPGERVRAVTLELNSAGAVAVYVVDNDGEINFLARVCGRERVRFVARGRASLRMEPLETNMLYVYTRSGGVIHLSESEKEKWSKYHERRAYDPNVELAKYIAARNMMDMDNKLAEMRRLADAIATNNAAANNGGNGPAGTQPPEPVAGPDAQGGGSEADDSPAK